MNISRESIQEALVTHLLRITPLNPFLLDHVLETNSANGLRTELQMARLTPIRANNGETNENRDSLVNLLARIDPLESR